MNKIRKRFALSAFLCYLCTREPVQAIKQYRHKRRRMRPKVPYLTLAMQIYNFPASPPNYFS
nr:MAG TPA: hypothetical protein [Caudoviricetes sp.]